MARTVVGPGAAGTWTEEAPAPRVAAQVDPNLALRGTNSPVLVARPDGVGSHTGMAAPHTGTAEAESSPTAADARRWSRAHRAALAAVDLSALLVAAGLGILVGPTGSTTAVAVVLLPVWMLTLAALGAYDLRHVGSGTTELPRVGAASVRVALAIVVIAYVARSDSARDLVLVTLPVGTALLLAGRVCARVATASAHRRGRGQHRVLAVGTVNDVLHLIDESERNPGSGFHVVGACVPRYDGRDRRLPDSRRASAIEPTHGQRAGDRRAGSDRRAEAEALVAAGVPVVGAPHDVLAAVKGSRADTVVVAGPGLLSRHALRRLAWQFEGTGVRVYFASSLSDVAAPRITMRPLGSLPLLHVESPAFAGRQRLLKSAFDRLLSAALVVVLAPLLVVVAVLVKLDSPGPVLYRQERIGRNGTAFRCLKIRTMRVGAEHELAQLRSASESDGVLFKIRADPRVTRVGRVVRRYSLDELPQLFNVIGGSMSLVGPRPPLRGEVAEYGHDVQRRLLVKPGMTGLWQVSGRSDLPWAESVRLDLYYVENWSLYFDLQLMARTVGAVAAGRGAY